MKSWSVLQLDEPVVGDVEDYESAHVQLTTLQSNTEDVAEQFSRIQAGDIELLLGQTAEALRETVGAVDDSLKDLPFVLGEVSTIFQNHSRHLRKLRQRANEALARAGTRWNALQAALTTETGASSTLQNLQSQLQSLGYSGLSPDQVETESARLHSEIEVQESYLQSCKRATSNAQDDLHLSRVEHAKLHDEERDLISKTVNGLDNVDLRGLANRDLLQKIFEGIGGFFSGIGDWIVDLVSDLQKTFEALSRGDFGEALHHFRDALDKLSTAIMVVGVIVCVIAAFFTGGASLALIPTVLLASEYVDQASQTIGETLFLTQTPHPETGEPISWQDITVDKAFSLLPGGWKGLGLDKPIKRKIGRGMSKSRRWQNTFKGKPDSRQKFGFDPNRGFRDPSKNADLLRRPRSRYGRPIHGAAHDSQRYRSGTELASEGLYDAGEDSLTALAKGQYENLLENLDADTQSQIDRELDIISEYLDSVDESRNGVSLSDGSASCQLVSR